MKHIGDVIERMLERGELPVRIYDAEMRRELVWDESIRAFVDADGLCAAAYVVRQSFGHGRRFDVCPRIARMKTNQNALVGISAISGL